MKRKLLSILVFTIAIWTVFSVACTSPDAGRSSVAPAPSASENTTPSQGPAAAPALPEGSGRAVASEIAPGRFTVTLASSDGEMKKGPQEITLIFTDKAGTPFDVGAAELNFRMPAMGSMAEMNNGATLTTTKTPGVYKGKVTLDMGGEWQALVTYEGSAGNGSIAMPIVAK